MGVRSRLSMIPVWARASGRMPPYSGPHFHISKRTGSRSPGAHALSRSFRSCCCGRTFADCTCMIGRPRCNLPSLVTLERQWLFQKEVAYTATVSLRSAASAKRQTPEVAGPSTSRSSCAHGGGRYLTAPAPIFARYSPCDKGSASFAGSQHLCRTELPACSNRHTTLVAAQIAPDRSSVV